MSTRMGDLSKRRDDRGAVATEYGLMVTLVSVLIGGLVAAFGTHLFPDPCSLFPTICATDPNASNQSSDGGSGSSGDQGSVPSASPTGSPSASPTDLASASATDSVTGSPSGSSDATATVTSSTSCPSPSRSEAEVDICPSDPSATGPAAP